MRRAKATERAVCRGETVTLGGVRCAVSDGTAENVAAEEL